MILYFFILVLMFSLIFYIITYPYKFKLRKKLNALYKFKEVEKLQFSEPKYLEFAQETFDDELVLEEIFLESEYTSEKMRVLTLKDKNIGPNPHCLILFHGIKDLPEHWLLYGKLREIYLTLKKDKKIKDMVFCIPASGYHGESWYTNFYKDKKHRYEYFFSKTLTEYVKKSYPNSLYGIAGFSMGGYGAFKIGLKYIDNFDVIASFSGAISLMRLIVNRRVIRLFKYIYIPRFLFNDLGKLHFIKVFSSWGKRILKNDPYSLVKNIDPQKVENKIFYLSVGSEDKLPYFMLQQWIDVAGRLKKYNFNFKAKIYENEFHTWEFISKDLYNFLIFFNEQTKKK